MFERYRRWDMQDGNMDARRLTRTRHSFKFRIAGRGRKGSQRFSWTAAKDLFRKLPLQILISVALDSCGGNSPAAGRDRLKNFVAFLLYFQARPKHSML